LKLAVEIPSADGDGKLEPAPDREESDKTIKELYKKLQALFPGIDPKKEPAYQAPNPRAQGQVQQGQQGSQGHKMAGIQNQGSPPPGQAQKMPQMVNVSAAPTAQTVMPS
jgi:hypothetical protein